MLFVINKPSVYKPPFVTASVLLYLKTVEAKVAVNVPNTAKLSINAITTTEGMFIQQNSTKQSCELVVPYNLRKGLERLHNLQCQIYHHLSVEITENIEHKGVIVDEGTCIRNDLTEVVNEHISKVNAMFPGSDLTLSKTVNLDNMPN